MAKGARWKLTASSVIDFNWQDAHLLWSERARQIKISIQERERGQICKV